MVESDIEVSGVDVWVGVSWTWVMWEALELLSDPEGADGGVGDSWCVVVGVVRGLGWSVGEVGGGGGEMGRSFIDLVVISLRLCARWELMLSLFSAQPTMALQKSCVTKTEGMGTLSSV